MRDLLIVFACQALLLLMLPLVWLSTVLHWAVLRIGWLAVRLSRQHSPEWNDREEAKRKARIEENF